MTLRDDRRSQAIQIGAVLLFGVLIVLFASYQAFVVPDQNRAIEFNHNERVQGDMVEVRNAILESKSSGADAYAEVELGTQFPPRLIARNPAPPSGSLSTTDSRPIVVEAGGTDVTTEVCPGTDVQTRFLEYAPSYSAYRSAGTVRYEHSILYHDFGGQVVTLTGQRLVSGDTLQLVPLRRPYNTVGSRTVAVEPVPGQVDTSRRSDVDVVLPTNLSEAAWEEALAGEVDPANVNVSTGAGGQNVTLDLDGSYRIECGPVGLGETPPSGSPDEESGDGINPAAPGDVKLIDETRNNENFSLFFNNTAGTNNFTEGRLNFYDDQGNGPTSATIQRAGESESATMVVGEDFEAFDPTITLPGDGTVSEVVLTFDKNVNPNDWFVITLRLESGERAVYFVPAK